MKVCCDTEGRELTDERRYAPTSVPLRRKPCSRSPETLFHFTGIPSQAHDSPEGRKLLASMGPQDDNVALVMDRAYQGDETRQLALDLGFTPVVPPLKTRTDTWEYDREMYKRRNEVERLFRRLKGYRRIFSRFEKLDVMFIGFIHFVLIFDALR